MQTCLDRGLRTLQGKFRRAPWPGITVGGRTSRKEQVSAENRNCPARPWGLSSSQDFQSTVSFLPREKLCGGAPQSTFCLRRKHFILWQWKCQESRQGACQEEGGAAHWWGGEPQPPPQPCLSGRRRLRLVQRASDRTGEVSNPMEASVQPVRVRLSVWGKMETAQSCLFINRCLSHTRVGNNPPVVSTPSRTCRVGRCFFWKKSHSGIDAAVPLYLHTLGRSAKWGVSHIQGTES